MARIRSLEPALLLLVLSLILEPTTAASQPHEQDGSPVSAVTAQERGVASLQRSTDVETAKLWVTALATGVPLLAALCAVAGTIMAAKKTLVATFTAKAAELALQGEGPNEVLNRAKLLARLYGDLLPPDFLTRVEGLDAAQVGRIVTQAPWTSNFQKEIIALLAQYPQQRQQIISDFQSMFPDYKFIDRLMSTREIAH